MYYIYFDSFFVIDISQNSTMYHYWTCRESGNMSDGCIREKSGFLDFIEREGGHVVADRFFFKLMICCCREVQIWTCHTLQCTRAFNNGKDRHLTSNDIIYKSSKLYIMCVFVYICLGQHDLHLNNKCMYAKKTIQIKQCCN